MSSAPIRGSRTRCRRGRVTSRWATRARISKPEASLFHDRGPRAEALARFAPFLSGQFPYFRRQAAGDVVALSGGDPAHAGLFGDAAGAQVGSGFGRAQDGEAEDIEPE